MDARTRSLGLALGITAIALVARIPTFVDVYCSADQWIGTESERVALALLQGRGWSDPFGPTGPTAHLAPGYPVMLAGLYTLFGTYETSLGRIAEQSLALTLTIAAILMLPLVARRLGTSVVAGWSAALLVATLPGNRVNEVGGHHEQALAALLVGVLVLVLDRARKANWTSRSALETGGTIGATALIVPNLLLVPAFFIASEFIASPENRRRLTRGAIGMALIAGVLNLPWMCRNCVVLGGFVPTRSNLGLELRVGNHDGATGFTYADGFIPRHPFGNPAESERLVQKGELAYMRDCRDEALGWIREHPYQFAKLIWARAHLYLFTLGIPGAKRNSAYAVLGIAALWGAFCLIRKRPASGRLLACALFGIALPYIFTHVEPRYRQPVIGVMAILACDGVFIPLEWLLARFRRSTSTSVAADPHLRAAA
jgi:hypothetical protein